MSFEEIRQTWERLGEADPLWAVLSTPGTRDGAWDVPWFLETGRIDLGAVTAAMSSVGVGYGRQALDFGCGVGRLTQVLAEHVDVAVGVDLAESMIRLARENNTVGDRVRFVRSVDERLPFDDDSFDSAVSLMVLQHLPPRIALRAILELLRVVRPGGILAVQIPSHPLVPAALPASACRAEITALDAPGSLPCAATRVLRVAVTNRGAGPWPSGQQIRLANHWRRGADVVVGDDGRTELPHGVQPGETVELELRVTAPETPGRYALELDMVQEFVAWWAELGSPTTTVDIAVGSSTPPVEASTEASAPVTASAPAESAAEVVHGAVADHAGPGESAGSAETDGPGESGPPGIRDSAIEMHPIHVTQIRSMIELLGGTVLTSNEDDLAGPGWVSYTHVIQVG